VGNHQTGRLTLAIPVTALPGIAADLREHFGMLSPGHSIWLSQHAADHDLVERAIFEAEGSEDGRVESVGAGGSAVTLDYAIGGRKSLIADGVRDIYAKRGAVGEQYVEDDDGHVRTVYRDGAWEDTTGRVVYGDDEVTASRAVLCLALVLSEQVADIGLRKAIADSFAARIGFRP